MMEGDSVRVQMSQRQWIPGKVRSKSSTPRSYVVDTERRCYVVNLDALDVTL